MKVTVRIYVKMALFALFYMPLWLILGLAKLMGYLLDDYMKL